MADRPTCDSCPSYHAAGRLSTGGTSGVCRVRSVPADDFPRRVGSEWCGEHPKMPAWLAARRDATLTIPAGLMALAGAAPMGTESKPYVDVRD